MSTILEANTSSGTNTTERHWVDSETAKRREAPMKQAQYGSQGDSTPPVDLVQFESGSNVYGIALGRKDEFIVPASDDSESAILKTPGADLSSDLQRVLPFVVRYTPRAGFNLDEVMERLLRCNVSIRLERGPSFASTQLGLSVDKWMAQVRAWASSHPQSDRVVDDSRESIYGDRP